MSWWSKKASFSVAYGLTRAEEQGYANHKHDTGGETYGGISRKNWPNWFGWKLIDEYKIDYPAGFESYLDSDEGLQEFVKRFYQAEFWWSNRLGELKDQSIANEIFDTGVNQGLRVAAKHLQNALNLLNRNQRDYRDLIVDGRIGKITLRVVNNHRSPYGILKTLNGLQFEIYHHIAKNNPVQEEFFLGWLNRV